MLKMDFKYEVNGRSVPASQFGREFKKAALAGIEKQLRSKIASIRCPVHGRGAANFSGDLTKVSFEMCCGELKTAIEAAMK